MHIILLSHFINSGNNRRWHRNGRDPLPGDDTFGMQIEYHMTSLIIMERTDVQRTNSTLLGALFKLGIVVSLDIGAEGILAMPLIVQWPTMQQHTRTKVRGHSAFTWEIVQFMGTVKYHFLDQGLGQSIERQGMKG